MYCLAAVREEKISSEEMSKPHLCNREIRTFLDSFVVFVRKRTRKPLDLNLRDKPKFKISKKLGFLPYPGLSL